MRLQRLLPALVAFVLVPASAAPVLAQYRRPVRQSFMRGYELNPYITLNQYQDKTQLDDEIGVGFRFGYLYTPNHEIEFLLNSVTTNDSVFTSDNVTVTDFQLAYVYNFTKRDVVPYVTAGVGFVHTRDDDLGTESDFETALGGGVRFFLGRAFFARIEARRNFFTGRGRVYGDGEDFHNDEFAFGVGWRFGAP